MRRVPENIWAIGTLLVTAMAAVAADSSFDLTIFHINDFHVRLEETDKYSARCRPNDKADGKCFGGVARLYQAVKDLRQTKENNVIFLNAGDMYQGTVWYTKFKSDVVWPFMNSMNFTAAALGNHEFDDAPEGLLPLARNANFDVVCANCDFSSVPAFRGLVKPHTVVRVGGRQIGIVGYTTAYTSVLSNPQSVTFSDELAAVKAEAKKLKDAGVDIIIGLGHVGYSMDKEIARQVPEIDLIIGGHSHSFLYTGDVPSIEMPSGGYPTMVRQEGATGRTVPVVQAYAYTKYLGRVEMKFDCQGERISIEGKPLLLDSSYPQNPEMLERLKPWQKKLESLVTNVVGSTKVLLEAARNKETTMGDFLTDAVLDWYRNNGDQHADGIPRHVVALQNSGGIRNSLSPGNITTADLLMVLPFANTVDSMMLDVETITEALELSAATLEPNGHGSSGRFLQVAGMKFTIDLRKPVGSRIRNLRFRVKNEPEVFEEASGSTPILVYANNFIAKGNDGYKIFKERRINFATGALDTQIAEAYLVKKSPVEQKLADRITIIKDEPAEPATGTLEREAVVNNMFLEVRKWETEMPDAGDNVTMVVVAVMSAAAIFMVVAGIYWIQRYREMGAFQLDNA